MDKSIITLIETNRDEAFKHLYEALYNKIFSAKRYRDLNVEDKVDIFHDALLTFTLKVEDGSVIDVKNIEAWFSGVCKNIFFNRIKSEIKATKAQEEFQERNSDEPLTYYEEVRSVFKIMRESLDEGCVELLTHYFVNGLDFDEIAERMNYTRSYVKNKKSRCLKRLKSLLKNKSL